MNKLWIAAKHEYKHRIRKRSFLLSTMGIPAILFIIIGLSVTALSLSEDRRPMGMLAATDAMREALQLRQSKMEHEVVIRIFSDPAAAQAALGGGEIQAFLQIPESFPESGRLELHYWDQEPDSRVIREVNDLLSEVLLSDYPETTRDLLINGPNFQLRSADGGRQVRGEEGIVDVLMPFASSFFFFITVMMSSGFMLQAVADEKENRTMEILVTSILPEQLLLGKLLGLLAVAMTQIFVWISLLSIGIAILSNFISALQGISLPLDYLSTAFLFFLPSFVMISGLMTAIGSIVTDYSQGQQIAGLLNLPFMLPWFLSPILFSDPNHPLMVFLTMVPMSSFLTIAMRWSLTSIPFWQISISWLLLAASSAFSLWSATKIFRLGMLSYGKRLSLRAIFAGLQRTAVPALKDREAGQEV